MLHNRLIVFRLESPRCWAALDEGSRTPCRACRRLSGPEMLPDLAFDEIRALGDFSKEHPRGSPPDSRFQREGLSTENCLEASFPGGTLVGSRPMMMKPVSGAERLIRRRPDSDF